MEIKAKSTTMPAVDRMRYLIVGLLNIAEAISNYDEEGTDDLFGDTLAKAGYTRQIMEHYHGSIEQFVLDLTPELYVRLARVVRAELGGLIGEATLREKFTKRIIGTQER